MEKPTLIYFPARGRAEVIRLVLAEAGVEYQEHPVGKDSAPQQGRPTDFGNSSAQGRYPLRQSLYGRSPMASAWLSRWPSSNMSHAGTDCMARPSKSRRG